MKTLSKEKRDQFIIAIVLIAGVLVGLYFGLIRRQQQGLEELAKKRVEYEGKLEQVQRAIKSAQVIEADLAVSRKLLNDEESNMASGDKFLWMINFVSRFKARYHVDIPQFDRTTEPADVKLLLKFPYKQVSLGLSGTGYFHDLGKFVSDFENQFPTSMIMNLEMSPAPNQTADDREKLSFRMQIVTLVKSDSP